MVLIDARENNFYELIIYLLMQGFVGTWQASYDGLSGSSYRYGDVRVTLKPGKKYTGNRGLVNYRDDPGLTEDFNGTWTFTNG